MADQKRANADNVAGDFFVDHTCIDCDLCRQIAPATFFEGDDHSFVGRQPESVEERHRALMALVACPTGSIGSRRREHVRPAIDAFPERVTENVYFCGFAAEDTYGAASYLILRPEGNILVDSPRFATQLVRRIEAMGGISLMCLSHRDDVGDHQRFHDHFGCDRAIHRLEVTGGADESMARLQECDFEWVLPGHGRRVHLPAPEMARQLKACVEWMRAVA